MATYLTGNPAVQMSNFKLGSRVKASEAMTIQGAVNKAMFLTLITILAAFATWRYWMDAYWKTILWPYVIGAMFLAMILSLFILFKNTLAPWLSPFYALTEGITLGMISANYEERFQG